MIISDHLARSRTGIWSPLFGHARREAGCPAVGGLVRIVWFFRQFRSLVRPWGRAWLMLRLGPLDSGVWLFAGICFLYKARLRRKPSLATCRIDRIWGYIGSPCLVPYGDLKPFVLGWRSCCGRSSPDNLVGWPTSAVGRLFSFPLIATSRTSLSDINKILFYVSLYAEFIMLNM